ncbi:DUF2087 domain-containing protein [Microbacterium oleivorans]|uniref:DUF2087 domain-containing protein n=1 Tax=Microbacterium oleivorans TaxID=273677 RepID=A0A4R5YPQ2_9MICO|nr:DUF2087 domain-containing protein [Microbacterium oleivorans]TDL45410.1 DUF2087 domain-containing protein [Microbacterium oleivorans]
MDRSGDDQWRPLVAALANDRVREAFARLTLGASADDALGGLSPSRRRHVVETMRRAGLVTDDLRADGEAFARVLASAPAAVRPTGVARYLSREGRVIGYPSNPDERRELLTLLAARILAPGEILDERGINERLEAVTDDVAALRRHLVDHDLVERTRSGTEYALVVDPSS